MQSQIPAFCFLKGREEEVINESCDRVESWWRNDDDKIDNFIIKAFYFLFNVLYNKMFFSMIEKDTKWR